VILWDVNLWVYAFRSDSPMHETALFCPYVVTSFLRLVTNPRIFSQPSRVEEAWGFA